MRWPRVESLGAGGVLGAHGPAREFGVVAGGQHLYGFHRWRGDYGGKKQLWFPSNYVEEMVSPAALEPEREVRAEPCGWGRSPAHVASGCLCAQPPRRWSLQAPWSLGRTYPCQVCVSHAQTPLPHVYSRLADSLALPPTALGREQPPGGLAAGGLGCASLSDR